MAEGSFTYFNKNNGDVVTYPRQHARLEHLQNWVSVEGPDHLAELQADRDGTRSARGNLLGSSNIGDRSEERHQVPAYTPPTPAEVQAVTEMIEAGTRLNRENVMAYMRDDDNRNRLGQPEGIATKRAAEVAAWGRENGKGLRSVS